MVITQIPPLWTDRDDCFRCHTTFSAFTRKHHCRACGETFCSICSSKQSPLHEYGVEEEVRVCISCYDRIQTTGSIRRQTSSINQPKETSQAELDEEAAFQLALSLSQREAEEKERQKKFLTQQYAKSTIQYPPTPIGSAPMPDDIEQNYWENQTKKDLITIKPLIKDPLDQYVHDAEIDTFVNTVNEHINNIKFRMLSNQQRGRNIANDTAVQSVFLILQHMYPELHGFIKSLDDKQAYYENLQDKLSQLKDAREALNALREEHFENKKRQALERERQRQIQLAVKLDDMRQKKQAYLEYQRQLHLQRLAQQEAEMQARLDQQRRYTQQREQQNQMPYTSSVPVGYYHPIPSQFSMGQLSNALPSVTPTVLPQNVNPYTQQFLPPAPTSKPNEQTLILFD
jgi:growth factor-regulated tyrosine kinase substrate